MTGFQEWNINTTKTNTKITVNDIRKMKNKQKAKILKTKINTKI